MLRTHQPMCSSSEQLLPNKNKVPDGFEHLLVRLAVVASETIGDAYEGLVRYTSLFCFRVMYDIVGNCCPKRCPFPVPGRAGWPKVPMSPSVGCEQRQSEAKPRARPPHQLIVGRRPLAFMLRSSTETPRSQLNYSTRRRLHLSTDSLLVSSSASCQPRFRKLATLRNSSSLPCGYQHYAERNRS